jgi:hypothetical protein
MPADEWNLLKNKDLKYQYLAAFRHNTWFLHQSKIQAL